MLQLGRRPNILIVDDQPTNIRIVHAIFKDKFDVLMATNGEQALAQCLNHLPDLVLLDIMMPDINGHEVCTRLKANPLTSHIPVIFLTAHQDEDSEILGFELGAVDFITKPINLTIMSARVSTHLALKFQQDILEMAAMVDGLTGVANRRKFNEYLTTHRLQSMRKHQDLSLLMLDVDFFKRYNDHYGHPMGDECLKKIAQVIKQSVQRPYDLVARYGGEEFVCLLPETNYQGAVTLANKILDQVRMLAIPHQGAEQHQIVTLSIGVATMQAEQDTDALVKCADQALYAAKQAGRNQVA